MIGPFVLVPVAGRVRGGVVLLVVLSSADRTVGTVVTWIVVVVGSNVLVVVTARVVLVGVGAFVVLVVVLAVVLVVRAMVVGG